MELIADDLVDFDQYFEESQSDLAKVKPASSWVGEIEDRFHGETTAASWQPMGWPKTEGKFDLRPGELTIWAGINGHGKTTFLSHAMLNVMAAGKRVCLASMEMRPRDSMAKMVRQAAGTGTPTRQYIRAFGRWTDGRLWIYDHVGKVAAQRILAVATYVRKELGIEHFVIDSLMKCGLGTEDYTAQKDFVDSLCTIARDTGLHIHLVCHMRKGETETRAPEKFDVKGAGEITDLTDNLVIVWKNKRKQDKPTEQQDPSEPDAFVRIPKQRHHDWEGSFAFWFDKDSQQFLGHERERVTYIPIELEAA